jgi:zinc protease
MSALSVALSSSMLTLSLAGIPVIGPAPAWTPPLPVEKPLVSGARLWVSPKKGVPLVHLVLSVPAGSAADPKGQEGLAALTATVLEEGGAGSRSGAQLLEAFEALGTTLEVTPEVMVVRYSFSVASNRFDEALALLLDVIRAPRFEPAAFESAKSRQVAELVADGDDPGYVALQKLMGALFRGTARAHLSAGLPKSVAALTLEDVKKFYQVHYGSAGLTVVVSGDISADGVKQKLDALAPKAWLKAPDSIATYTAPAGGIAPTVVAVDKPGAAQTVVMVGKLGPAAADASLPALEQVGTVLGGSFTSRLNQNLREKNGYTYGVRTQVVGGKDVGLMLVQSKIRTAVTGEALEQLFLELGQANTVTEAELTKARALGETDLVEQFSSGANAAATLAGLVALGRPADWLSKQKARNAAVTVAAAQEAAKAFQPAGLVVVLVGDRQAIEKNITSRLSGRSIGWVPAAAE